MNRDSLAVAFVGSVVSDAFCEASPACSVAGNKFLKRLIAAVEEAAGREVQTVSYTPASMFPRGRKILYGTGLRVLDDGRPVTSVPFVNLPILKQLTQGLGIFLPLCRWLWANRASRRVVIVYNVFSPHSLPVLAATRLFGSKAVALVADLPHDFYDFRGWQALLQRLDFRVQTNIISSFDGQITVTRNIADDFAPAVPALLMEGGVEPAELVEDEGVRPRGDEALRICMFSGLLNDINGVELLLEAFAQIRRPEYRLWIFGRGPLESMVKAAASQDGRINYGGFRPNAEILARQRDATVLINPRPSHRAVTRYTFPSKLHEYMLSGRPVLTTLLPGIPEEYHSYLLWAREETPEGLAASIEAVCAREDLTAFGERAREFVLREKNWERQGARVYNFVSQL